jgi:hypothetical protein
MNEREREREKQDYYHLLLIHLSRKHLEDENISEMTKVLLENEKGDRTYSM